MKEKTNNRDKGGRARAEALTPEERKEIAKQAAAARWKGKKTLKATHKGNFKKDFGIDVDCYVLDDDKKTAVIIKAGMNEILGFSKPFASTQFIRTLSGSKIAPYVDAELKEKLANPIVFQGLSGMANAHHGYDVTILIDICKAIIAAESEGKLLDRQSNIAKQAHTIVSASAKAGITGLAYALAGYEPTAQEVIDAFKAYIQEEARKYEPEFPNELYMQWHRLYEIPVPERGKPWQFKYLTVNHVYTPLADSNGKILELTRIMKAKDGDRQKKLFQFLNEIGVKALRQHLGVLLGIAKISDEKQEYERNFVKVFGGQQQFDFTVKAEASVT